MPRIEKHPAGSFCWVELATSDQPAAKKFYTSLFGWSADDMPMGPDDFYTMFRLEGRDAGAAYTLRAEQRERGVPPHWNLYVAVENADAAVERATSLGGKALGLAFDVFDAGRMANIQDPTGAMIAVWEAKRHTGVGITGVHGTLAAADLSTPDQNRAAEFYSGLFGWRIGKEDEHPEHAYFHLFNGEKYIGGILPPAARSPHEPPHWQIYFTVTDCGAAASKAKAIGGRIYMPPTVIEDIGRMAVLADPQGASFSLFQATEHLLYEVSGGEA